MPNKRLLLLQIPLQNFHKLGFLTSKGSIREILTYLMVPVIWSVIILLVMQFPYINGDINSYVNNLEGAVGIFQLAGKLCVCLYNKKIYLNLVRLTKKFFNEDECATQIQEDNNKLTKRVLLLQKIYFYAIAVFIIIMYLNSIVQKTLLAGEWHMKKNILFTLTKFTIYLTFPIITFFVVSYDCLYLSFCFEVQKQCKILCGHLEMLNMEAINCESQFKDCYQKLQTCIEHHILLLDFHNQMQKAYSVTLMVQYLTATSLLCVELYALTEISDSKLAIRYILGFCAMVSQTGFYCFPANYVEHHMSTMATAVYNSGWYSNHSVMMRTPIILMIQRSQQRTKFTACGLIEINNEAFIKMMKMGFSIYVALKGFKN